MIITRCFKVIIFSIIFSMLPAHFLFSAEKEKADYTGYSKKHDLIEHNWGIRYILLVGDAQYVQVSTEMARDRWQRHISEGVAVGRSYEPLLEPSGKYALSRNNKITMQLITFDRNGNVTSPSNATARLFGRRTTRDDIVLIEEGDFSEAPYFLAYWFMGVSVNDQNFAPAVCNIHDFERYRKDWRLKKGSLQGNFGCREWTHQLHTDDRPYIDVSSYEKGGAFIKEFIGWADFRDAPKPVIGKHEKTWWCLHECPDGQAPGVIPDIAAWTRRHGFPLPKRPRKQPEFPDSDFIGHWDD